MRELENVVMLLLNTIYIPPPGQLTCTFGQDVVTDSENQLGM